MDLILSIILSDTVVSRRAFIYEETKSSRMEIRRCLPDSKDITFMHEAKGLIWYKMYSSASESLYSPQFVTGISSRTYNKNPPFSG